MRSRDSYEGLQSGCYRDTSPIPYEPLISLSTYSPKDNIDKPVAASGSPFVSG